MKHYEPPLNPATGSSFCLGPVYAAFCAYGVNGPSDHLSDLRVGCNV
jgi:hypothetical protein